MAVFDNYISLGYYCGVAASMSKIGIRSTSGPFDWYISGVFKGVVSCLENDFSDFLCKDNIEVTDAGMSLTNTKYFFQMGHEIRNSFEEEYESINEKYMRRIKCFREQIKQKTCFIRTVYNVEELKYILENQEFINDIIKRFNIDNEIIYIVTKSIFGGDREESYPFYLVDSYEARNRKELRGLFEQNIKLCKFCIDNYDETHRYKNMVFDLQKEICGLEYRYDLMDKIDRMDMKKIKLADRIVIYGAGRIGKYFYNKVKDTRKVLLFIDKSPKEKFYDGIPVIAYGNPLDIQLETPVVVSACYEYEEIRNNMLNQYGKINILSLMDLF